MEINKLDYVVQVGEEMSRFGEVINVTDGSALVRFRREEPCSVPVNSLRSIDVATPRETIEAVVKQLAERYPEAGFTFGYIGNDERWGDDRGWYILTQVKTSSGSSRMSYGGVTTWELPELADSLLAGRHLSWLNRVLTAAWGSKS